MTALLEILKLSEYDRMAESSHTAENNSLPPSPEIELYPYLLRTESNNKASVLDINIEQNNKQGKEYRYRTYRETQSARGEYIRLKKFLLERT